MLSGNSIPTMPIVRNFGQIQKVYRTVYGPLQRTQGSFLPTTFQDTSFHTLCLACIRWRTIAKLRLKKKKKKRLTSQNSGQAAKQNSSLIQLHWNYYFSQQEKKPVKQEQNLSACLHVLEYIIIPSIPRIRLCSGLKSSSQ